MVATPQIIGPDGTARDNTVFSTTIPNRFFRGTIDQGTVDMQISIRGGAFTSDPDLIVFEGDQFFFPNPAAFPEGLELTQGKNLIRVRSVGFNGSVSDSATLEVTLVQQSDIGLIGQTPTNISIEQLDDSVTLQVEGVSDPTFVGINFYAARFQGGGDSGYQLISLNTVSDAITVEEEQLLRGIDVTNTIATNPDGTPAADPLFLKIKETQTRSPDVIEKLEDVPLTPELAASITEQEQDNLVKTDFVQTFEVPEVVNRIRTVVNVSSVVERQFYLFNHNRIFGPANTPPTVAVNEFRSLSNREPLYYVATAVYYDPELQLEIESPFSIEVAGRPVTIQDTVGTFPSPSRIQIVEDVISSLRRTQPTANVAPGGVLRDTFIDPFSDEASRLRFLVDFLYRSQSFDTLLQIDGIEPNGESTPVSRSPYKQGLQRVFDLSNPDDVQVIIDTTFEQLASRQSVFRRPGVRARGLVTFFTSNRPSQSLFIGLGTRVASGGVTFVTTSDALIPLSDLGSFFNPVTGLYSVDVTVQAEQTGTQGNLSPGQIRTILSVLPGLSVTNRARTFGGLGRDSNLRLSERARSAPASVDSGTEQGIRQVVADVAGVEQALVVSAGDPLMQRDYDPEANRNVGGKADVWIRGVSLGQVTDNFAFTFEVANDVQFGIVGNPNQLVFRSKDKTLSPENPLSEMIDRQDLGLGFRNATSGQFFDLTDVRVLDYRTIQLSSAVFQPPFTFGDVLLGDYRYQTTTTFTFTRQPVNTVVSVTGQISGPLPEESFQLINPDDPLQNGRSTEAQSFLRITPVDGVPSGAMLTVQNEQRIMIGQFDEFLGNLGVNPLTVRVFNVSRTVEYRGPDDPSGFSDYSIVPGSATRALAIRRTENSQIQSGQRVLVDYEHAENFSVAYDVNFVVSTTQDAVEQIEGVTYDILVKEAVAVPVDVTATVIYQQGAVQSTVDRTVRTNLATFINSLNQGGSIRQSDIISVIDNSAGVSFVQTPLVKLLRGAGSRVVREPLLTTSGNDVTLLLGGNGIKLTTDTVQTFLINGSLDNATINGGGNDTNFRGVFEGDRPLDLITTDFFAISQSPGQAYIIGNQGLSIPGFSDDDTLTGQFPTLVTDADIRAKRRELTANRVVVSLGVDDRPQLHQYTVTYTVSFVEQGVRNLLASQLEYFVPGDFILTFEEDPRGN